MSISADMRNVTIQLTVQEKAAIGRESFRRGLALGAWIREAILWRMAKVQPEVAAGLAEQRLQRAQALEIVRSERARNIIRRRRATP